MTKVIVVGGGASGLTSAIILARRGYEVMILEKNDSLAKKILVTGNGRCNYWNEDFNLKHYHSSNEEYLKEIIYRENQEKALEFLKSIGIIPKIKNGYFYPYSNQAISVKAALINEIDSLGIKVVLNDLVKDIKKEDDEFRVFTRKNEYKSNYVILSVGSFASFKDNQEVNSYELAKNFHHTIIPVFPSLTQIYGKGTYYKDWNGIRLDATLSLYEDGNLIKEESGEIHLTDYGISGICTFNLSGLVAKGISKGKKEIIEINFLSDLNCNEEELIKMLNERNKMLKKRTIDKLFDGFINYKLVLLFLKLLNISKDQYYDDLTDDKKLELAKCLLKHRFEVLKTSNYDKAQVCSGGVCLSDINPKTLESLKVKNLYFTGEVLDVDGDCGGYNLGFAWISGVIVGNNIGDDNA